MSDAKLVEGIDYTIDPETGFFIFTREYLLKRGFCCESACRNCPYGYVKKPNGDASSDPSDEGPVSS